MNKPAHIAALEDRQAMIRVWLAISAIWVGFWLILAIILFAAFDLRDPLPIQLSAFCLIIATPPFALFAIGAVSRWLFETAFLRNRNR